MTRKKDDKTQTAESKDKAANKPTAPTSKPDTPANKPDTPAGQTAPPPEARPLVPQPSGEPPTEDAEAAFVKTRTAERFYRCGLEFGRNWRLVERKDLSEPNWQRLLAEPHLVAQGVVLTAEEPAS